ncbi:protein kinase domain-containing protein [Ditylenchus destructor]|uniref:Protein kinase domain-containing protein n=1 Tax=Ditylenchus destructor TaxID=166010 RepID=A0AAD4MM75_9BILA|nr:protein kinase domain-containing protein [Ditylenchus destructor]
MEAGEKQGEVSTSGCSTAESSAIPAIQQWTGKMLRIELDNGTSFAGTFELNEPSIIFDKCTETRKNYGEEQMPTKSQNVEGSNADEKTGEVSTSGCPATESNAIPAILQWLDKNQSGSAKLRIQLVNKQVYQGTLSRTNSETIISWKDIVEFCMDDEEKCENSGAESSTHNTIDMKIRKVYEISPSATGLLDESGGGSSSSSGRKERPGRLTKKYKLVSKSQKGHIKLYQAESRADGKTYFIKMIKITTASIKGIKEKDAILEAINMASVARSEQPAEENKPTSGATSEMALSAGKATLSSESLNLIQEGGGLEKRIYLVSKYYGEKDLEELVNSTEESERPNWQTCCLIATQIASALAYLHKSELCHNDIHLANIIMEQIHTDYRAVLIDFGDMRTKTTTKPVTGVALSNMSLGYGGVSGDASVDNDRIMFVGTMRRLFYHHQQMLKDTRASLNGRQVTFFDLLNDENLSVPLSEMEIMFGKQNSGCNVCREFRKLHADQQAQINELTLRVDQQQALIERQQAQIKEILARLPASDNSAQ